MTFSLNTKKIGAFLGIIFSTFLFLSPVFVYAQNNTPPAVPSEQKAPDSAIITVCVTGAPGECTFDEVIAALQKLLKWGRNFALMFSVIVLAYAGFKYMISGDFPAERAVANKMLRSVAIGIVFILSAWLIVDLILKALGATSAVQLG